MVKNTDQTYMKTQPVLRLLLTMALPMVISMLVNSLYNIVDSFFVAKISEDAMTALSLVYPMQNLINAVMIGFGVGINAVISFYLGAQNQEKADRAATQGVILSTIHGILLMVFCLGARLRKGVSGSGTHGCFHGLHDDRVYCQYYPGSDPDIRTWTFSTHGD